MKRLPYPSYSFRYGGDEDFEYDDSFRMSDLSKEPEAIDYAALNTKVAECLARTN